jgi:hypothetical protein
VAGLITACRSQTAGVQYLAALVVAGLSTFGLGVPAWAGAWVPGSNQQQVIATASLAQASDVGDAAALEIYAEHGLGHGLALVTVAGVGTEDAHAAGQERLTAIRFELPAPHGWAISGQFGYVEGPRPFEMGDFTAIEQRIAIGRGWNNGTWFDASYAVRDCDGNNAARWDAAVGHRFGNGDQIIAKTFGEDSVCGIARDRVQVSYVREVTEALSIEVGWRETLSSYDGWGSRGVVVGLWRRF